MALIQTVCPLISPAPASLFASFTSDCPCLSGQVVALTPDIHLTYRGLLLCGGGDLLVRFNPLLTAANVGASVRNCYRFLLAVECTSAFRIVTIAVSCEPPILAVYRYVSMEDDCCGAGSIGTVTISL